MPNSKRKRQPDPADPAPRTTTPAHPPVELHVLSDSTGNLARHILTAVLTQFPAHSFHVTFSNFLDTSEKLDHALKKVANKPGIVMHAVVGPPVKESIAAFCRGMNLKCFDLTGGFVDFLRRASGIEPASDPNALHRVDEAYRQRIDAIEFTLAHDDGLGLDTLADADVVLVGVSRTSKTPTSIYLSQLGYRAANVSLAYGIAPPSQLLAIPSGKVVALIIDPDRLVEIRRVRQTEWRMTSSDYGQAESVAREISWSRSLFTRQGWPIIDITRNAVEETAARVIEMLQLPRF